MTKLLRLVIAISVAVTLQQTAVSQSLSVNTDGSTAHPTALLDVKSTAKGILVPRMSKTQKNAITSPATGLLIFQDTPDSTGFYYFDGTKWSRLDTASANASTGWLTTGNTGTDSAVNFLGTLDNKPLMLRQNNRWMGQLNTSQKNYFIGGGAGANTAGGTGNNAYGDSALFNVTTGSYNTAIGNRSMLGSGAITGGVNVAVGNNTLSAITTGSQNVAVGDYALASMKTGGANVILGPGAMETATKGTSNVGLGLWALRTNDSASNNIAIGQSSLYYNDSARSVGVGYEALAYSNRNNITGLGFQSGYLNSYLQTDQNLGIQNTYLGYQSGYYANTGSYNVAVGNGALVGEGYFGGNSPGNVYYKRNVAIGDSAMAHSYGSDNVAVGYRTLSKSTSTNQHVAVGSRALMNTTHTYPNTAIGYSSQDSTTTGGANTSVGSYSLTKAKGANNNTAIGNAAMYEANNSITPSNLQNNTAVGNDALRFARNFDQTAIGAAALRNDTSGYYNTAVGYVSMFGNLSGIGNSAVGVSSLRNNTTGDYNTALGTNALYNHKTNDLNTAVGYQTMFTDTSGSANVAMGWNALFASRGTQQNVAIGVGALEADSTGSYNTAVGRSAAFHADSSDFITAIGYNSLAFSNRDRNTALGAYSGYANAYTSGAFQPTITEGIENTLVGYATMAGNAKGSQNVAVGYKAGAIYEPGTFTGAIPSRNVAIGDSTLYLNGGNDNVGVGYRALSKNGNGRHVAVGSRALLNSNAGYPNTAIGYSSQDSNTVAGANTSVGSYSLMSNKIGSNNTAIGNAAMMEAYNPAGAAYPFDNTAIGNDALRKTRYYGHVAVGAGALRNDTSGTYNTAVGYLAMYENLRGGLNTAVGTSALRFDTSGSYNTAVGTNAMYNHKNGDNSVALGFDALVNDIDGGANTALGTYAMFNHKTNGVNTAVGFESMYYDTAGSYNTAMGWRSLRYTKHGFENVAIGVGAIEYSDSSYYNTAVGRYAQFSIGGTYNTAIGYRSLGSGTGLTTTDYYVKGATTVGAYAGYKNIANENTFVGYSSGSGNILAFSDSLRGIENTGIGSFTLLNTTTGATNTATGFKSLNTNTTGSGNTGMGSYAGYTNLSGVNNVNVGYNSGYLNSVGDNNVSVGYRALYNSTSSSNVGLGYAAGDDNSTGSANTYLGYNASTTAGGFNNSTAIGANATVAQSNSLILGSINGINGAASDTRVGIRTNTPDSTFSVADNFLVGSSGTAQFDNSVPTMMYMFKSGSINADRMVISHSPTSPTWGLQYQDVGDKFNFLRAGTAVLTADLSNQRVGIGNNTPLKQLHVYGGASGATLNASTQILMENDAASYLEMSTPDAFENGILSSNTTGIRAGVVFGSNNSIQLRSGGNTTRLYINSTGYGGFNRTPTTGISVGSFQVQATGGSDDIFGIYNSTGTNRWTYYTSGGDLFMYNNSTLRGQWSSVNGVYTSSSDRNLKKDIAPLGSVLSAINKIQPYSYRYNDNKSSDPLTVGFMAQDLQPLFPEAVTEIVNKDGSTNLGIKYQYLSVYAIKAIQEQQKIITDQQKAIDDLLKRVEKLEKK